MQKNEAGLAQADYLSRAVETSIRLGAVLLLAVWCFNIVAPFIAPIAWGVIIAVAVYPAFCKLVAVSGGRIKTTATLLTLISMLLLIVPVVMVGVSMVESVQWLIGQLEAGSLKVPPPPAGVAEWPIVGSAVHDFWNLASTNLEAALTQMGPMLKDLGKWLLGRGLGSGLVVLQFLFSLVIAGVFLAAAEPAGRFAYSLAIRIAGPQGGELAQLASATVRSVAQGVLGIAVIQALLAGLGMFVVGVPAAGLWTVLILVLAVVQLPALIVLGPVIFYVFSEASTTVAVIFTIWSLLAGMSDTFLKPLLLGRGVAVPMLVILVGAIGGMITSGIVGLFVGAVVLALGYRLFMAWLENGVSAEDPAAATEQG